MGPEVTTMTVMTHSVDMHGHLAIEEARPESGRRGRAPGVVSGLDHDDVAGFDGELGSVIHADRHLACEADSGVLGLSGVGPGDRFNVLGPAPSGFEDAAAQGEVAECDDVHVAVVLERTCLLRGVDIVLVGC